MGIIIPWMDYNTIYINIAMKKLIINGCNECLFKEESQPYTKDGSDRGRDWYCLRLGRRIIATFIERLSEGKGVIPVKECPLEDN